MWGNVTNLAWNGWKNQAGPVGNDTYNWNVEWWFENTDVAPGEDFCTIILFQAGRTIANPPSVISVDTIDGPKPAGLLFSRITAPNGVIADPLTTQGRFRGTAISVYHCQVDRRKVYKITTAHSHVWQGNRTSTRNMIVLASGAMKVVEMIHPLDPGPWYTVGLNDIVIGGGARERDRQCFPNWNTSDSFAVGSHWYGMSWAGCVLGGPPRTWTVTDPNVWTYNQDYNPEVFFNTAYRLSRDGAGMSGAEPFIDGWYQTLERNPDNFRYTDMVFKCQLRQGSPSVSVRKVSGGDGPEFRVEGTNVRFTMPTGGPATFIALTGQYEIVATNSNGFRQTTVVTAWAYPYNAIDPVFSD